MANRLTFDEQNNLDPKDNGAAKIKKRSIPYNQYFGEMYLPEEEKEKRIEMASALDDVFLFLFATIGTLYAAGNMTLPAVYEMTERRYMDAIEPFLAPAMIESTALQNTIANQVRMIVDATVQHMGESYYMSEDRAKFIAENQANVVQNQVLEEEAEAEGKTHKIWASMRDNHVREDHEKADGQKVRIGEPFVVGGEFLMHPCDGSLGASGAQTVNCRCVVEYTSEKEDDNIESVKKRELSTQNVTNAYTENARPGYGTFAMNNPNASADEIAAANTFQRLFGGNIELLPEKDGQKNPDYLIDGKLWDLKSPTSKNSVSKRIQDGLRQIYDNPGGIIVDIKGIDAELSVIESEIERRMKTSMAKGTDVVIINGDEFVEAIRYTKE